MVFLLNPGYSEDHGLCVKSFQTQKATIKFGFYFSNIKKKKEERERFQASNNWDSGAETHGACERAASPWILTRSTWPTGEGLNKSPRSSLSISSLIPVFLFELQLKIPTDPLGTHLEFNPGHFIVEFIWIFFQSLFPESSEVFLLFPVVTKKQVKQVHSRKEGKKHNKQTLQASSDMYKMKLKRAAVVTRFDPHSTVADLVHLSVVSLLSQFYLKLITVLFSCKF